MKPSATSRAPVCPEAGRRSRARPQASQSANLTRRTALPRRRHRGRAARQKRPPQGRSAGPAPRSLARRGCRSRDDETQLGAEGDAIAPPWKRFAIEDETVGTVELQRFCLEHVIAAAAHAGADHPAQDQRQAEQHTAMRAVDHRRPQTCRPLVTERAHSGREAAEGRCEQEIALVQRPEAGMRQFAPPFVMEAHRRSLTPRIAGSAEKCLKQAPNRSHDDAQAVERALVVGSLSELDCRGIGPAAEHETLDPRVGIVALRHDERPALLDPARCHRIKRLFDRPARGKAKIDRQCVGLPARDDDQRRPALAEIARAATQHVAHRTVTTGNQDVIDPPLGKPSQHGLQLVALPRSLDQQSAPAHPVERGAGMAMAAGITDDADQRRLTHGRSRAAKRSGGPGDLRQAVEQMDGPVHVGALNPRWLKILRFFPKIQTVSPLRHSDGRYDRAGSIARVLAVRVRWRAVPGVTRAARCPALERGRSARYHGIMPAQQLLDRAQEIAPRIISLRRAIHAEPELGLDTPLTLGKVRAELADLPLEWREATSCTGAVAVLKGARPGPAVLLRGDMDALPMAEHTGLDFASTIAGRMHACGHDTHTAMLAGAARL